LRREAALQRSEGVSSRLAKAGRRLHGRCMLGSGGRSMLPRGCRKRPCWRCRESMLWRAAGWRATALLRRESTLLRREPALLRREPALLRREPALLRREPTLLRRESTEPAGLWKPALGRCRPRVEVVKATRAERADRFTLHTIAAL
jgi:hypothetical protein